MNRRNPRLPTPPCFANIVSVLAVATIVSVGCGDSKDDGAPGKTKGASTTAPAVDLEVKGLDYRLTSFCGAWTDDWNMQLIAMSGCSPAVQCNDTNFTLRPKGSVLAGEAGAKLELTKTAKTVCRTASVLRIDIQVANGVGLKPGALGHPKFDEFNKGRPAVVARPVFTRHALRDDSNKTKTYRSYNRETGIELIEANADTAVLSLAYTGFEMKAKRIQFPMLPRKTTAKALTAKGTKPSPRVAAPDTNVVHWVAMPSISPELSKTHEWRFDSSNNGGFHLLPKRSPVEFRGGLYSPAKKALVSVFLRADDRAYDYFTYGDTCQSFPCNGFGQLGPLSKQPVYMARLPQFQVFAVLSKSGEAVFGKGPAGAKKALAMMPLKALAAQKKPSDAELAKTWAPKGTTLWKACRKPKGCGDLRKIHCRLRCRDLFIQARMTRRP